MPYVRQRSILRRFPLGVGVYPNDPCYDPTRPSWLPYWLDTPSESGCKWGMYPSVQTLAPVATPPALAAPAAPQTEEQMVSGTYTPAESAAETTAQSQQTAQTFFNQLAQSASYGAVPTQCDPNAQDWTQPSTWCPNRWLIVGGTVLAVVLLPALVGGRRRR